MKELKIAILFCTMVCFQTANAQSSIFDSVKSALEIGSSSEVARFFDESVTVTIQSDVNSYSKTQAEFVLKNFFQKNQPNGFSLLHTGASNGGSQYAIGNYLSGGNTFTVLVRIRKSGSTDVIHEISFVKE